MRRISLNDSIYDSYKFINDDVLGIKSCVINLCSDIDRYFLLNFGVGINDNFNSDLFKKVKDLFPTLANLSLEQFNKLMGIVSTIRNVNAHLHLRQVVYIDDDIEQYFVNIVKPSYRTSIRGRLTMYGQAYILNFVSQKYNVWPFIIGYYRKNHFNEIREMLPNEKSNFQMSQQHLLQEYCGIGKPIKSGNSETKNWQYMNDLFRKYMTRILFSLEKCSINTSSSFTYAWSLSKSLSTNNIFINNKDILDLIIFLRNCWFHGVNLNDTCMYNEKQICLDYKFIFESFIKIKKCLLQDTLEFGLVIKEINFFASSSICFYLLRIVELTYKVLDNRLLSEDKLESRLEQLDNSFNRFLQEKDDFYELCGELIEPDDLEFWLGGHKFTDGVERITHTPKLKLIKIHSDYGIKIGRFKTERQDITFVMIDLEKEYQNTINGIYLSDYKLNYEQKHGKRISVFNGDTEINLNKEKV